MVESRGNENYRLNGKNIGAYRVSSTLHFGPFWPHNGYHTSTFELNSNNGFNTEFHNYQMEWTSNHIKFSVDDNQIGIIPVGDGFFKRAGFDKIEPKLTNVWENGTLMAPFDQEFHFLINLAVGGQFFPDNAENLPGGKPWKNDSPNREKEFWDGRDQWLPSWRSREDGKSSTLQVDYIKVWAV